MSKRILDINYKDFECIPFWKSIVADSIRSYFMELEKQNYREPKILITSINQMQDRRFRCEIIPERNFDKDELSSRVINSLREQELISIVQLKEKEVSEFVVKSLSDEIIRKLVIREQEFIRYDLEKIIKDKLNLLEKRFKDIDMDAQDKLQSYRIKLNEELSRFKEYRLIVEREIKESNSKLKDYDELKREALSIFETRKNLGAISLGMAIAAVMISLSSIIYLAIS